jgi:hypothetical protein
VPTDLGGVMFILGFATGVLTSIVVILIFCVGAYLGAESEKK